MDETTQTSVFYRLVAIRSEGQNPLDMQVFVAAFPEAYRALVDEKPITCIKTGKILPGVPAPNAAILDVGHACLGLPWSGTNIENMA